MFKLDLPAVSLDSYTFFICFITALQKEITRGHLCTANLTPPVIIIIIIIILSLVEHIHKQSNITAVHGSALCFLFKIL